MPITVAILAVVVTSRPPAPLAPGEEKHPGLGVALDLPPRYEPVPVQPREPWIVLRYVQERKHGAPADTPQAQLHLLRIDWSPDPDPPPEILPVTTFARFVEQRLSGWEVANESAGPEREGWQCREYELVLARNPLKALGLEAETPGRWAAELRSSQRTWVLLGTCAAEDFERSISAWRRCAQSLEFFEPVVPAAVTQWTRFYAKNRHFREPELRVRVRASLVEGWEALDTENYLLVHDTRNGNLVQHLAKRLEGIRRAYAELFPPAGELRAVSTVRVCDDKDGYHLYGGPAGTAGYWNPKSEELVLFDFESGQEAKEDARAVLFHEGFHQYIHYAAGELAPHSWFNEGYGDYFSGAEFNVNGNLTRIHVNAWRLPWIQQAIRTRSHPSWNEIAWMEQPEFYSARRSVNYAMGWSMIYFLEQSKAARKDPVWSRILPTYFETLKAVHARERARLEAEGLGENEEELEKSRKKAREEASSAAFRAVDWPAIEAAWREFTLELKEPK